MGIENLSDMFVLLTVIVGMLLSVFRYIDSPKRGWLYLAIFFLAHFLSDYYWTVYTLAMGENPEVAAFIANFGWNVSYIFLIMAIVSMGQKGAIKYFNPIYLLPIPLNIYQFTIYEQFGGTLNNIWQVGATTIMVCMALQGMLFFRKNRKDGGHFPMVCLVVFMFVLTEYGMWTSSCYSWSNDWLNPYYYCNILNAISMVFMPIALKRDYSKVGEEAIVKNSAEMKFQVILQTVVTVIILGGCVGGYFLGFKIKSSLPESEDTGEIYSNIAVILFIVSVFLVLFILAVLYVAALRYRNTKINRDNNTATKVQRRSKYNFIFTVLITLGLMIFAVIYNSRLYYGASVTGIYEDGEDKAMVTATDMDNYLTMAQSTLRVSADTVGLMDKNKRPLDDIYKYLLEQTENQAQSFDENFTGIYAYINGRYIDGSGWIPPANYKPETRDWYDAAIKAKGQVVIVAPYVDAQTDKVVITICKMLDDNEDCIANNRHNVVCLDVIVNYIQKVTESVDVAGKGYAMILNRDGFIVAHNDPTNNGKNISELHEHGLMDEIINVGDGNLEAEIDDEECTLFVSPIMDQWYVAIVVNSNELFSDVQSQLLVNIAVSLVIFLLISFFYYLGYKNEQAYGKKVEEMNTSRQKQEYEAQVLKLEKMAADEANKAKSNFLADMSHEIRTPINAILGMNEMIMRETDDKNISGYAKNVDISGKKLLQLINGILDFSKIEDGKMEIVPVQYDLKTLVTYLVNSVRERAKSKNLELIVDVDPTLPSELHGDDLRVNQVVMNLLTNAVKYTPEGSVTFTMKEEERKDGRALIYVEVKDTGIGIREEDMGQLFESFERLDVQKNRTIEGTGLGMAITTRLLDLMGSELQVSSVYGEGSKFFFSIWQDIDNEEPIGDYTIDVSDDEDEKYESLFRAPYARILVVDDTKMNLLVVISLLKDTGITIDTAKSGPEAIDLAKENAYDLIFMDQRMPGMDGTQTLKEIRSLENNANSDVPVICLTADAIRGAKAKYLEQGFSDYLAKPVEGVEIEKKLIEYLPEEKVLQGEAAVAYDAKVAAESSENTPSEDEVDDGADPVIAALRKAGVDTESGMKYSSNNEFVYKSVLSQYAKECEERSSKLKEYFTEKDWENYSVYIHSLKSTSKTIGATELSDIAAGLEEASRASDEAKVAKDHDRVLDMYASLSNVIKDKLDIENYVEDDEGDVIEFSPQ